jgi:hypothetical protein
MRALVFFVVLAAACGDNEKPTTPDDAGIDAGPDANPQALAPCLDRPTDLPRPPSGQLPCELLPPDFVAARPGGR